MGCYVKKLLIILLFLFIAYSVEASNWKQLQDQYGFVVENTPMDEMRTVTPVRLVGTTFIGNIVDSNFWNISSSGGFATQASCQLNISTGTSANGGASASTVRVAKYTGGSSNRFRGQIQLADSGTTNNIKRWGAFNATSGCFFEASGASLRVVTRKNSVDTAVESASWNGSTTTPTVTNVNTYEIYWTNAKVYYVIAGTLVHTASFASDTWTDSTDLPICLENKNINGSTTNTQLQARVATIYRLGSLQTLPMALHTTSATTTLCKRSAGILHRVVLNNPTNNSITISDANGVSTGATIAVINPGASSVPVYLEYGLPFNNGLTVVTAGSPDLTIVYE